MLNIFRFVLCLLISSTLCIYPTPKYQQFSGDIIHLSSHFCQMKITQQNSIPFAHQQLATIMSERMISTLQRCRFEHNHLEEESLTRIKLQFQPELKGQAYNLKIQQDQISLTVGSYQGYVYGLNTLFQLLSQDLTLPIGVIQDEPLVSYRGIMIDTARHFISVPTLQRLIVAMSFVKLNVLHWHLTDNEAFSFDSGSHPEVTKYGSLGEGQSYTTQQIKSLLGLARQYAVQVVPEIDTPAASRSWIQSPNYKDKNLSIQCHKGKNYFQQLDISKKETLSLVQDVVKEVDIVFAASTYFHLGGDRINQQCWNTTSIKTFKTLHNLKTFSDLINFWRYEVKQALPPVRKVIHWQDQTVSLATGSEDIIQYRGLQQKTFEVLSKSASKVILSPRDVLSLGSGFGGIYGDHDQEDDYVIWRKDIISRFVLFPEKIDRNRILGAEIMLEGHNTNEDQFENNLWMRAAAFAGRVWSEVELPFQDLLTEMVNLQKHFTAMGLAVSPVTVEICYVNPKGCLPSQNTFPHKSSSMQPIFEEE